MKDTTGRGDVTEQEIIAALTRDGLKLLRPISSATRYDLAIDRGDGTIVRVQCKTGMLKSGSILFRLFSVSGHTTRAKPYKGQVDAFGVYCPQTDRSYLVPVAALEECSSFASLRIVPSRNGQVRRTRLADEYVIGMGLVPSGVS